MIGLNNRRSWQSLASTLLQHHHTKRQPATLMMIDVDRFKQINDRYGHNLDDDVLCNIAAILHLDSSSDAHIGRFGGDEFSVALPVTLTEARVVAEHMQRAVEELNLAQAPAPRCPISIGLSEADDTCANLRQRLESADQALCQAKQSGRNSTAHADRSILVSA